MQTFYLTLCVCVCVSVEQTQQVESESICQNAVSSVFTIQILQVQAISRTVNLSTIN